MTEESLGVDAPPVTASQATILVAHHLSLAAAYYELANQSELHTLVRVWSRGSEPASQAGSAWLNVIETWYQEQPE